MSRNWLIEILHYEMNNNRVKVWFYRFVRRNGRTLSEMYTGRWDSQAFPITNERFRMMYRHSVRTLFTSIVSTTQRSFSTRVRITNIVKVGMNAIDGLPGKTCSSAAQTPPDSPKDGKGKEPAQSCSSEASVRSGTTDRATT